MITLARDVALPHRDVLLDDRAMAGRLRAGLGAGDACERESAWYSVGKRAWAVYRVGAGERVALQMFARLEDAERLYARAKGERAVAIDRELNMVMWTLPHDPGLTTLFALDDGGATVSALLGRRLEAQLVAYQPGRRAVARCTDASGAAVAYAKVYHDDRGERVASAQADLAARLADDPDLRVPRVLAYSREHRMLVAEAASALSIRELPRDRREWGARRLGVALARLHDLEPPAGLRAGADFSADRLQRVVETVALMRPDARALAEEVIDVLTERRPRREGPWVCTHGDAHVSNALFEEERVNLIDLDDLSLAPAGRDFARPLARIRIQRVTGKRTAEETRAREAALLAGYGERRGLPSPDVLGWYPAWVLVARAKTLEWLNGAMAPHLVPVLREAREMLG